MSDSMYENVVRYLLDSKPGLKKDLMMARSNKEPREVVEEGIKMSIMLTLTSAFIIFLILQKSALSTLFLIPILPILLFFFFNYRILAVKSQIAVRRNEIDRDVLFAGRYLLVKLNSGQPLVNALAEASNSYGMANKYFKEIMRDIDLGKPVEDALSEAAEYSPSRKFKKIIFQISNALKIGIDVSKFLEATLDEIVNEQILEIKEYGEKLNSITLLYLLIGVVMPSLGMTLLTMGVSVVSGVSDIVFYGMTLFGLTLLQLVFVFVYKAIRPNLNI